ncbi:MAG: cytochrome c maturation protein CcmE [Gammaproteobacteria bacterium]|nr:cytochrome c maturation protein CcmE [Gammaproteobacteria bacterium]
MKPRQKRTAIILGGLVGLGIVVALVLNAFQGNLVFFFSPSQIAADEAPHDRSFRLGGLVEEGSLRREDDGLTVHFYVTDTAERVPVTYTGILPDLFTEGQGVVAQGKLDAGGHFTASEVLAKHDETYMSPNVAEALEMAKGETSDSQMPGASSLIQ